MQQIQSPTSSPKFAIPQATANIAMKYGKNVSRGIKEMERRLKECKQDISDVI